MYFDELDLNDNVLDALYDMRFDTCTPVQEKCIPEILEGHDVLGVAQTGTGKTAAYLLPVLSKLDDGGYPKDAINCVIMSPTRELAQQIDQAMQGFGYYLQDVSSVAVYGGNDGNRYDQELKSLRMGADVVIATPGRLITHISLGNVDLSKVSFFILDEADRMLDMGFSEDINTIAAKLPKTCQTIMFSATMPEKIEELAKSLLKDPVEIKLAVSKPAEKIKQEAYVCYETQKMTIIKDIFKAGDMKRVIIFSGSKMKVKQLAAALQQTGINCGAMHSDLEQAERDDVMFKFKSGQYDVLVATDIVARGIDIDDIEMVINYDVPHDTEDYVHRIGRTARANRDGRAITFVNEEDMFWFQQIEKFLEKVVEKMPLPEGCGEGPEYIKLNKPSKKGGRGGKGGNGRKGNGRGGNENGEKTKAKNRRQKDREQTAHKHKPNNPNNRQEKAPKEGKVQNGEAQQNGQNNQQNGQNGQNGQQKKNAQNGQQKQGNKKPQQNKPYPQNQEGEQTRSNDNPNNKRRNNKRRNGNNGNNGNNAENANPQQRPGTENNVRPGSNGRGRGVAQKKQNPNNQQKQNAAPQKPGAAPQQKPAPAQKKGDKQGSRKYEPVVNPQKKENVVKKIFNKIFGFKK